MRLRKIQIKTLGIYPVGVTILPGETQRLHIYQPELKALVNDCFASGSEFVIPLEINGTTYPFGTSVILEDVERFYPDGKMDIKVTGKDIVKISKYAKTAPTSYSLGEVEISAETIPSDYQKEISELNTELRQYLHLPTSKTNVQDIFEVTSILDLSAKQKKQLIQSAESQLNLAKIVLNELRIKVLIHRLQSKEDFKFYMN